MKKVRFEAVESEIRKEKAEALGRTGERLERVLHELERMSTGSIPCRVR